MNPYKYVYFVSNILLFTILFQSYTKSKLFAQCSMNFSTFAYKPFLTTDFKSSGENERTKLTATKKGAGSTKNGRDSRSQRLGLKRSGGQWIYTGNILVRQRGTKFKPGRGVMRCRDDTLMATRPGIMQFNGRKVHVDYDDEKVHDFNLPFLSKIYVNNP